MFSRRDLKITFYRSSGPGGQRKNKVETAVRISHIPTGITASATEFRSQAQNRALALERLAPRLDQRPLAGAARRAGPPRRGERGVEVERQVAGALEALGRVLLQAVDCLQQLEGRIDEYREAIDACKQQLALVDEEHRRLLQSRETLLGRIDVEDVLGNHAAVRRPGHGWEQGGEPGVPAEDLDDEEALVAAGRRAQRVGHLDRARDAGGEADAVVGPGDVVVHGLRDRDHPHALSVQANGVRKGVVAPDRDQDVDADPVDVRQDLRGQVVRLRFELQHVRAGGR